MSKLDDILQAMVNEPYRYRSDKHYKQQIKDLFVELAEELLDHDSWLDKTVTQLKQKIQEL